ncbi:hypothetical protein C5B42_04500 [Candidatus Cerribacteria bacterium 'Amazon FNV 2010 28 9']|uniref:Uncharacterized protein n=1 Tax=Candidatus Cerribacteria bacterium 'Amazon FNV 2010 28 9' TaxID=2081795 RepID=A0A317JQM6_9BACT|nr:MAG: hypothetical protein C5B42_04500 [Candidatus Cerribacteria bacterium 'Amazon FNV 2010 28 9']
MTHEQEQTEHEQELRARFPHAFGKEPSTPPHYTTDDREASFEEDDSGFPCDELTLFRQRKVENPNNSRSC